MQSRRLPWVVITLTALLLIGCTQAPASSEASNPQTSAEASASSEASHDTATSTVVLNTTSRSVLYSDVYVGIENGYFEDEGVDLQLTTSPMPNPPVMLLTGAANIISGWPGLIYIGNQQGADMRAFYSPAGVYEAWVSGEGITDPAQLEGQTIGVFTLIDLDVLYTYRMMTQLGFSRDDYEIRAAGISPEKVAAVLAGQVAAAPVYPPANFAARRGGLNQIFDTLMLEAQVPSLYLVSAAWAGQNGETLVAVARALNRAHAWLVDPANKEAGTEIIIKYTDMEVADAEEAYSLFFEAENAYTTCGEWTKEQFDSVSADMLDLGLLSGDVPTYENVASPQYQQEAAADC